MCKKCVAEHIVTYLNEQKVSTLQQAAVLADEFVLTHKNSFEKHHDSPLQYSSPTPISSTETLRANQGLSPKGERQWVFFVLFCFYHKPGHLVADCEALTHKQQAANIKQQKLMGLIKHCLHL